MKLFLRAVVPVLSASITIAAAAQNPMPKAAFAAKTVAIENNTKAGAVKDGALEQLQRWGHFTVVEDVDSADIVLRFDKKTDHERTNSQSTDDKGQSSWSAGMSFSSQVHMRAYLKGEDAPFYTTQTGDDKKKAGVTCVTSFENAWLEAH